MNRLKANPIIPALLVCILLFPGLAFSMTLEEKVMKLEKIVAEQQKQIEALTNGQKPMKGATPVPGPIIMIGVRKSAGNRKNLFVRRKTFI